MRNGETYNVETNYPNLIARVKALASAELSTNEARKESATLTGLLERSDPAFLTALRADRDATMAMIRLLSRTGATAALSNLLANYEIPYADKALLTTAIDVGLGGDGADLHKWMIDYDVVGQRIEMIGSVVLPYLDLHCREKTLFRALKVYEAESLASNAVLADPVRLHDAIGAARAAPGDPGSLPPARPEGNSTRLVLPNEVFNILLRLAWTAQDYVFDLHERYGPDELVAMLRTLHKVVPVYLIPTHLGYPMGGGESFMYQTCRILSEFGVKCVWVSFLDPKTGWYQQSSLTHTPYYVDVRYGGGCSKEAIQKVVDQFSPDLIHAQGGTSDVAMEIAEENRLTTLIGYHFWHGLVELGASGNQHILDNIDQHALRTGAPPQSRLIHKYVASEFMQEVYARLGGKEKIQVIHPISDAAQFLAPRDGLGQYVLQVNVCRLKGGDIFRDCVKALGETVPFMGVRSEPGDNAYYEALEADVAAHPRSRMVSYGNVRDFYRDARIVIVPTLVDETFCRVAFEAAMNGIPVLCTANGYLPSMLGDTGVFLPEESEDWVKCIAELYHDEERLRRIGEAQRARLMATFGSDFGAFISSAMGLIDTAATRNIGIFTVWGDLGLGNLSHVHSKLLRNAGYRVHIFSFQPYASIGKGLVRQQNPDDWSVPRNADSVYYSFNHREEVTVYELSQFILTNQIHTLLVPEVCWEPNWERLFAVKINKLKICTIPMIEIVIRGEILHHNRFTSTLYCTRLAEQALTAHGVHNGAFLGFGIGRTLSDERMQAKRERLARRDKIRFLHIAGHNPKMRKNTPQVMEAFAKALALRDDIELTVTSMDPLHSYYPHELPEGITVIDRSLGRDEIFALYEEHDVSIQVSSHEGLGLGFYESISHGTPVISLDASPHNEVVLEGETGWLVPAYPIAMRDNDRSIVSAWRFDTFSLTERIVSLTRNEVDAVTATSVQVYRMKFDEVALQTRFLQVLPRSETVPGEFIARPELPVIEQVSAEGIRVPETAAAMPFAAPQPPVPAPPHGAKVVVKRALFKLLRRAHQMAKPLTRRLAQRFRTLMIEATDDVRRDLRKLSDSQAGTNRDLFIITHNLHDTLHGLALRQQEQFAALNEATQLLKDEQRALSDGQAQQNGELFMIAKTLRQEVRNLASACAVEALSEKSLAAVGEVAQGLMKLERELGALASATRTGAQQRDVLQRDVLQGLEGLALLNRDVQGGVALLNRDVRFVKDRMATYAGPEAVLTYLRDESPLFVNTGDLGCPSPIVNGGVWEPENLAVLQSFVTGDTVFVDVGANVGYYAIAIGNRLGKSGRVYAFEPHPELANLIERSVQLNSLEHVVTVSQCAVSDSEGSLELFYPEGHLGRGTASREIDEPGRTLSIPAQRLDLLLPPQLRVDLMKIDVEGHELAVMRGMEDVLRRSPDIKILFEKLDSNNADNDAIAGLLDGHGLALYGVGPNAVLVPLDAEGFRRWVGDVVAAKPDAVQDLVRTSFSIYPDQLSGVGENSGTHTLYRTEAGAVAFFGPYWYLEPGRWEVQLHGTLSAPLQLAIVEGGERTVAELALDADRLAASFELARPAVRFEVRATSAESGEIGLERITFRRM